MEFHETVARGFHALASSAPDRIVLIERDGIEKVHETVISHMTAFLEGLNP